MSWTCPHCGQVNDNSDNNCTNSRCPTHDSQRNSNRWWKCSCGHYNYENKPYCDRCGKPESEAVSRGG